MEAPTAACRVLCLAPRPTSWGLRPTASTSCTTATKAGLYNAQGIAYCGPLVTAFDGLRQWSLTIFPLVARGRRRYVERFLGFDDGRSVRRLLDLVARMVDG
jgi:hypothetical protein